MQARRPWGMTPKSPSERLRFDIVFGRRRVEHPPIPILQTNNVLNLRRRDLDDLGVLDGLQRVDEQWRGAPPLPPPRAPNRPSIGGVGPRHQPPARPDPSGLVLRLRGLGWQAP